MTRPQPIKTALCAFGMSGRVFHAPLLRAHPQFQLTHICQRSPREAGYPGPEVAVVDKIDKLIHHPDIELIVVNTPDYTHAEFAARALEAGKHVVIEKPMTLTSAEADPLIDLAQKHERVLSVFQNRRWDADFLTVQKILKEGALGRLVSYRGTYQRFRPTVKDSWKEKPQAGASIVFNLGSHLIDQACVLFGRPEWVWADIRKTRTDSQVPDFAEIHLGYPETQVVLNMGYLYRITAPKFALHGEHGSYVKYGEDPQEAALAKGEKPTGELWGAEPESAWGNLDTHWNGLSFVGKVPSIQGNYRAYYDDLAVAIREGRQSIVTAQQARQTIELIEYAYQASESGSRVMVPQMTAR
ncbi:Gfo/Idh/MocA family oxidoreductase [Pontibacter sp. G13]|uniref:Gfo/Idh/MocA family oxidoreductase n=1 Tax=Pontibacter sp. G13 TaxID=3074898 RepID=UPI00288A891E|nr:Gfo/Idh/MocA family oxidoreductase [Pontibacter sp. G13]WNJ17983.1 Gfo/Idh/MocA family oxidoreductase [Pontibacter sp. G13]